MRNLIPAPLIYIYIYIDIYIDIYIYIYTDGAGIKLLMLSDHDIKMWDEGSY